MYIVVLDEGTSSTRAILFDLSGNQIKQISYPITQYYPNPGWVEHCPNEIWNNTQKALKEVCDGLEAKDLIACGITNQRETSLLWNRKTGEPITKAIVWQDRRTEEYCKNLKIHESLIHNKTGLKCDPYFSASKIHWILKHHPHLNPKDLAFGTIDSFILWHLTGGLHYTDITNASRTLLFNIHQQDWDKDLLDLFEIPSSILPEVLDSDAFFGNINKDILGFHLPIRAVLGDQQAALVGIGALEESTIKVTYGTGGFVMQNTGLKTYPSNDLLATIAYRVQKQTFYALEGPIYDAGSMFSWLKNNLKLFQSYTEVDEILSNSQSNNDVYFVPSFSGMGAPHWSGQIGASFTGMTRTTENTDLIRAVLESLVYQTQDILNVMVKDTGLSHHEIRVDGGMAHRGWLLQFLADLSGLKVLVPYHLENTAQGVAMVAVLSSGLANNLTDISDKWQQFKTMSSNPSKAYHLTYQTWSKEVLRMIK